MRAARQENQARESVSLLPKTIDSTNIFLSGSLGKFTGTSKSLSDIADDLEDKKAHTPKDYHSIPDFFAPIKLFESVCEKREHPLCKSMVEQWRGLLTIILMYRELNMHVDAREYDLNQLALNDALLFHVAKEYLPLEYNGKITVYRCMAEDNSMTPIALQSKKALICPVNMIKKTLHNAPDFIGKATETSKNTNGKMEFKDVAAYLKSNPLYGAVMTEKLRISVRAITDPDTARLLQSFIDTIGAGNGTVAISMLAGETLIPELKKHLVLQGDKFLSGSSGYRLSAETIFTDKIYLLGYSEMNKGCYTKQEVKGLTNDNSQCYALLPLRRDFICAYIRARLADGSGIEQCLSELSEGIVLEHNGNKIRALLTIRLSNQSPYRIQYDYFETAQLRAGEYLPASPVTVWPNKNDPANIWKNYFIFQSANIDRTTEDKVRFIALDYHKGAFYECRRYEQDGDVFFTTKCDSFPYVLNGVSGDMDVGVFLVKPAGSLNASRSESAYVGIDFGTTNTIAYYSRKDGSNLTRPKAVAFQDNECILNVIGSSEPSVKTILDLHHEILAKHFVPYNLLTQNNGVFGSVWHILNCTPSDTVNPLIDGNILFAALGDPNITLDERLSVTNLKWGDTAVSRRNANNFIAEIAMLCAWKCADEDCGEIHWRAAYPTAYKNFGEYHSSFRMSIETIAKANGFSFETNTSNPYNELENRFVMTTENHAAGIGLANHDCVSRQHGFISIDIGGGSTDISIWQKPRSKDADGLAIGIAQSAIVETSFQFAGNRILGESVYNLVCRQEDNIEIFFKGLLGITGNELKLVKKNVSRGKNKFLDILNELLRNDNEDLKAKLSNLRDTKDGLLVTKLIKIVEFNLAAIASYAAYLLSEQVKQNRYTEEDNVLDVVFSGNGSKLLLWVHSDFDDRLKKLFSDMAVANLPSSKYMQVNLIRSPIPKKEVAYGLVAETLLFPMENLKTAPPKDYALNRMITGPGGERDKDMNQQLELLKLFMKSFITRFLNEFPEEQNYKTFFPDGYASVGEVVKSIESSLGDNSSVNMNYSDGFAFVLEKLNGMFWKG